MIWFIYILFLVIVFLYLLSWIAIKIDKRNFWFNRFVRKINSIDTIGTGGEKTYIDGNNNYLTDEQMRDLEIKFIQRLKKKLFMPFVSLIIVIVGYAKLMANATF